MSVCEASTQRGTHLASLRSEKHVKQALQEFGSFVTMYVCVNNFASKRFSSGDT